MRTTVTLDDDVAAAVDQLRGAENLGLSEAVNRLARQGIAARPGQGSRRKPFQQPSVRLGLTIDVTNVAEAIEVLEGATAR